MNELAGNAACRLLGCEVPVVLAGMGGVSRHQLVAAVTRAGGFGFLGMVREPPALIAEEVAHLYAAHCRRFGVNLIPAATERRLLDHQVRTCIELRVPVVGLFWDIDDRVISRLRDAGILVVHQVGSVDEAIAAERAGAEIIIVQGREAGGHVRGTQQLASLLPDVVGAVRAPVLAAGGLVSGGDLITAQALGADGIVLGTALLATKEAFAHDHHKERLLEASAMDTVLTDTFHINWPAGAPVRVLKSAVTLASRRGPETEARTIIGEDDGRPIYLFSTDSPLRSTSGELEAMALYAGTGVGAIIDIPSAAERIGAIVDEAAALLAETEAPGSWVETSSPACFMGEMTGDYMGQLSGSELASHLLGLAADLRTALRTLAARPTDHDAAPFPPGAAAYARWLLRLRREIGTSDLVATRPPATGELGLIHAALLHRLSHLIPRLGDTSLRDDLSRLREFIEAQRSRTAAELMA